MTKTLICIADKYAEHHNDFTVHIQIVVQTWNIENEQFNCWFYFSYVLLAQATFIAMAEFTDCVL